MTDSRDLIRRLVDALQEESDWINNPEHDALIAESLVYLKETFPALAKEQRPDRLVVGDIVYLWEHVPQYEEMTYIGTKKRH